MPATLTEPEFRIAADGALESLERALLPVCDEHGVEVELQNGVLQVLFENPPTKFVVSPNAPVRQIWLSAMSRSYKLSWSAASNTFELNGEPLEALVIRLVHENLGS